MLNVLQDSLFCGWLFQPWFNRMLFHSEVNVWPVIRSNFEYLKLLVLFTIFMHSLHRLVAMVCCVSKSCKYCCNRNKTVAELMLNNMTTVGLGLLESSLRVLLTARWKILWRIIYANFCVANLDSCCIIYCNSVWTFCYVSRYSFFKAIDGLINFILRKLQAHIYKRKVQQIIHMFF